MLDDLKMIHQRDTHDMLGFATKQVRQLTCPLALSSVANPDHIQAVVWAGVGDAYLAASIVRGLVPLNVPFQAIQAVQRHNLPTYVGTNTLFIVADVDGNNPRMLDIFNQAVASGAQIVIVTADKADSTLLTVARDKKYPVVLVPTNMQYFMCWGSVKALLLVLKSYNLIADLSEVPELEAQAEWCTGLCVKFGPETPTQSNPAKQIALELMGKSVVVYAGPQFLHVARYWKSRINVYAKQLAWYGQYVDDRQYAEVMSWLRQPTLKPYGVVEFRSPLEDLQSQKVSLAAERLLSGIRPASFIIEPEGDTLPQQTLYVTILGDFVAVYLALLGGTDPSVLDMAAKINKETL